MKKLALALMILTGFSVASFAQRGGGDRANGKKMDPKEMAIKRTDKMKTELNLSDKQYQQLLALNEQQSEKMATQRQMAKEEMKAKREAMKGEREAYNDSLKSILNPEQYKQHEAAMEARKAEMKGKRGERGKENGDGKKGN